MKGAIPRWQVVRLLFKKLMMVNVSRIVWKAGQDWMQGAHQRAGRGIRKEGKMVLWEGEQNPQHLGIDRLGMGEGCRDRRSEEGHLYF